MKISGVVALLGAVVASVLISGRRPVAPQAQPAAAVEAELAAEAVGA